MLFNTFFKNISICRIFDVLLELLSQKRKKRMIKNDKMNYKA